MPAAELSRLQAQISAISNQFSHPAWFVHNLLALLELYADRNYRPGNAIQMQHLHPEYHVPKLVLQELETTLSHLASQFPAAALEVIDLLIKERHFEPKYLAAAMLSNFPAEFKQPVLERIRSWIQPQEDEHLIDAILNSANQFFLTTEIESWLFQIQEWLQAEDIGFQKIGLRGLKKLVEDIRFTRFEKSFLLLEPVFFEPVLSLQRDVLEVLKSLIKRSEMESVAFIRSIQIRTRNPEVNRFIRRCIPLFSIDVQQQLMNSSQDS